MSQGLLIVRQNTLLVTINRELNRKEIKQKIEQRNNRTEEKQKSNIMK